VGSAADSAAGLDKRSRRIRNRTNQFHSTGNCPDFR
jgi:hypothetical protein